MLDKLPDVVVDAIVTLLTGVGLAGVLFAWWSS